MSATIGIKAAGFSNITRSLKNAGKVLGDAKGIASSVKSALDMEVKSKSHIESNISEFIRKSRDSDARIGILRAYTEEALSDFFDKDKINAKKAPTVPKSVNKMAKNLFTITAAAVIAGVTSIASGIFGGAIKIGKAIFSKVTELFTGGKKKETNKSEKSAKKSEKTQQKKEPVKYAYNYTDSSGTSHGFNDKNEYKAFLRNSGVVFSEKSAGEIVIYDSVAARDQAIMDELMAGQTWPKSKYKGQCPSIVKGLLAPQGVAITTANGKILTSKIMAKEIPGYTKTDIYSHSPDVAPTDTDVNNAVNAFTNYINTKGEPLTNIVVSMGRGGDMSNDAGHTLLISRIENGQVYFVDNTYHCRVSSINYETGAVKFEDTTTQVYSDLSGISKDNYNPRSMSLDDFMYYYFKKSSKQGKTHITGLLHLEAS